MLETLMASVMGVGFGAITTYIIAKKAFSEDRILDIFDSLIKELTENVDYQKRIYVVGGLLGQGIGANLGLRGKSGKFKMEDIAGQFIGGMMQKWFGGSQQPTVAPTRVNNPKDEPLGKPFK